MTEGVIYKISFASSLHFYVGSAMDYKRRKRKHLGDLRAGHHHAIPLQRAFDKYGESLIQFEVLQSEIKAEDLIECEQSWIDKFDFNILYNVCKTAGSRYGIKLSVERRKEMSEFAQTRTGELGSFFGKKHSELTKQKIKEANTGRKLTQESIQTQQETMKRLYGGHPRSKKIRQLDKIGNVIRVWDSITDASEALSIDRSSIKDVCSQKPKKNGSTCYARKTAGGFRWEYDQP